MAAATVTSNVILNDTDRYAIQLTCLATDTGESAVVKIDKSTLVGPNGAEPSKLTLLSARWSIGNIAQVTLLWDDADTDGGGADTDVDRVIMRLVGVGSADFTGLSGLKDTGSGGTGDILLTTGAVTNPGTYDITLVFKKQD